MTSRERFLQGLDVRLSQSDEIRENYWLDKIETAVDSGRVLVVCGCLHLKFLVQKVGERGGTVLETATFPPELVRRKPELVLDPAGLEDFLRKLRQGRPYSEEVNPLANDDETETRQPLSAGLLPERVRRFFGEGLGEIRKSKKGRPLASELRRKTTKPVHQEQGRRRR
jgi:hypothetical protein